MSSLSDNCSYFKDLLDDMGSSLVFSNVDLTPRKVVLFKASARLHRRSGAYTTATSVVFTARCYASAVLAVGLCTSVCLCPSVTSRCSTNSAKHRITQTTPHDSPGTLVFWCQRSAKFDRGHPLRGRRMQVGWVKIGDFRQITGYISKTVKDRHIVSIKVE